MTSDLVEQARSWLFVPGDRPDRFDKAAASGADLAIIDLEDAVPEEQKSAARGNAAQWLADGVAAVRVNPFGSGHHLDDVEALAEIAGLQALVLPMAESVDVLTQMHDVLGDRVPLIAQIETAVGLSRADELAATPGVVRLAFGHLDFAADVDASPEPEAMAWARSSLVVASRVAGVAGPIDSVTVDVHDAEAARQDAERARSLGFTGKLCVHPRQIDVVNVAMSPTPTDIAWAEQVLAADDGGVALVDGQMVDAPVVARAKRIMARAKP